MNKRFVGFDIWFSMLIYKWLFLTCFTVGLLSSGARSMKVKMFTGVCLTSYYIFKVALNPLMILASGLCVL